LSLRQNITSTIIKQMSIATGKRIATNKS
jgi:hypothetical protein